MRRLPLPLALLVAVTSATSASAETVLLDERRVVELTLRSHPTLDAARATRDAARAAAEGAERARLPDVRLTGRYGRLSSVPVRFRSLDGISFPQFLDNLSAGAALTIPVTDVFLGLAAAARAAGHAAAAAELEVTSARAELAYEARVTFLEYGRQRLAFATATELVRATEQNLRDQRNRARAGTVARNDVLPFETAADDAATSLAAARGELLAAEAALRVFLPDLAGDELAVAPGLGRAEDPAPAVGPAAPPSLAALEARARAAGARADATSLDRLPKLNLTASAELAAPSTRVFAVSHMVAVPTWEAGAQIVWTFGQLVVGNASTDQARAEEAALRARVVEARRKLTGERAAALARLAAAAERARCAEARVRHAEELAQARRGELEAGTALPLNVIVAETELARAKNEHAAAFVDGARERARLDALDGRAAPASGKDDPR